MKHVLTGLVVCLMVLAGPARAAQSSSPAAPAKDPQAVQQAIDSKQAEVTQLKGDVAREETKSHDSDAQIKQKDQTIAELKAQLKALNAAPKATGH